MPHRAGFDAPLTAQRGAANPARTWGTRYEVGAVGDEVVEQGEHVAVVGAVGGGRESEQEGGVEGVEHAAVGGRVGVVDFVDDDVVGRRGEDALEVLGAREFLDGGDDDEWLGLEQVAGTPAHVRRLALGGEEAVASGGARWLAADGLCDSVGY